MIRPSRATERPRLLIASVHPSGLVPNQRFRIEQYVDYLEENGVDVVWSPVLNRDEYQLLYSPGRFARKAGIVGRGALKRVLNLAGSRRYDVVYVPREAIQLGTAVFERAVPRLGPRLVFDFDDAIWLPNASEANRALAFLKRPEKTEKIVAAASLVFAGNDYLADYARQFSSDVVVIPTTIDTDRYQPRVPEARDAVCIGWSGSLTTMIHFALAVPVLRRLKERFGDRVYFKLIGDPGYRSEELGLQGQRWNESTEVEDLAEIDIGIMPLPDDAWSKGKCGLKGLQYMALGIATVMSPVGVNSEIVDDGVNGLLAASEDEWVEKISRLVESPELRARLGTAGRETVVRDYSVASQRDRYLDYFKGLAGR